MTDFFIEYIKKVLYSKGIKEVEFFETSDEDYGPLVFLFNGGIYEKGGGRLAVEDIAYILEMTELNQIQE